MNALHKIWLQSAQRFLRKRNLKMLNMSDFGPSQWMTLTFNIHIGPCTYLVNYICQLWYLRLQQFLKIQFYFFPSNSIRDQIWPCRKIGQGQPRVIIWTNLVVFEHRMLHTMFQGHLPFGSGEEDILRFLPYMGMAAILVMLPGLLENNFFSPDPGRLQMKFVFSRLSCFWGEDVWKCWHTYTHTDDRGLPKWKL